MPRQYPPGFRDELTQRMVTGEPVLSVRDDTGVPEQTLHHWRHQGLIDAGLAEGIDSTESASHANAARTREILDKTILELEYKVKALNLDNNEDQARTTQTMRDIVHLRGLGFKNGLRRE